MPDRSPLPLGGTDPPHAAGRHEGGESIRAGVVIDLPVSDLAYGGAGVGRSEGLAVFVPGAVPGDLARVRVHSRKPNYAQAELVALLEPSQDRIVPRCAHFGACGGCQWMNLSYEEQLHHKERQVRGALERIGKIEGFALHPIVASPEIFAYRNRMEFTFGWTLAGLGLGLHRADDPALLEPIAECHIQDRTANDILNWVLDRCRVFVTRGGEAPRSPGFSISGERMTEPSKGGDATAADGTKASVDRASAPLQHGGGTQWSTPHSFFRRLTIRKSASEERYLIALATLPGPFPEGPGLARAIMGQFPVVSGVVRRIVADDGTELSVRKLAGEATLRGTLAGLSLTLTSGAFLQVNSKQAEALYRRVQALAAIGTRDTLLDLYCGVGAITILLGRGARKATGVEHSKEAVRCAETNARANGAERCSFLAGDASRVTTSMAMAGEAWDAVVLNPPRAGLPGALVDSASRLSARRILYVSCNPATLARDLARFASRGYKTTNVAPFDMFPHTYHVETIARLERA